MCREARKFSNAMQSRTSLNFVFFATVVEKKRERTQEKRNERTQRGETRDRTMTLRVMLNLVRTAKKCIHLKNKFAVSFLVRERCVLSRRAHFSLVPVSVSCLMNFT